MPASENSRSPAATAAAPQPARSSTFGDRLRREREMRGIKLEEIAESTKIGKRNLLALEEEHFDQLPGGIFNKGFVRAYAKFLGLDEEQAVNDFLAASANYEQPDALQPPVAAIAAARGVAIPSDRELRRKERRWAIAALLMLVLAGLIYWKWKPVVRPLLSPHPRAVLAQPQATPAALAQLPSQHASEAPAQSPQAAQRGAPPFSGGANSNSTTSTSQSAARQSPATGVTLTIHATEPTWLSATADAKPLLDAVLTAGESRELHAKSELVLKTGNAGGIGVTFNGQQLPALGKEKEVKTLTFTAEGLEQPTTADRQR